MDCKVRTIAGLLSKVMKSKMILKSTSSRVHTQATYRKLNGIGTQIHPVYLGWIVGWSVHNMIAQQRRFAGVRLAGRLPRDPDRLQHGDGLHIPGRHRGQQLWTGGGNKNWVIAVHLNQYTYSALTRAWIISHIDEKFDQQRGVVGFVWLLWRQEKCGHDRAAREFWKCVLACK